MLWIAFKSLYLWYSEQPARYFSDCPHRCELLSKVCIFDILNNTLSSSSLVSKLWIAFKSLYLWYSEQLEELYIEQMMVVNCFQKFVSLIFWTTYTGTENRNVQLWIAFKSLYLWYSEQPLPVVDILSPCCELLSKVCIFDILNNRI